MATKETMADIRSTCDCAGIKFCPYEKTVEGMSDRLLEQIKVMDCFKKNASTRAGYDIGWNKTSERWVDEGYAKAFATVWRTGMTHKQICKAIREIVCPDAEEPCI